MHNIHAHNIELHQENEQPIEGEGEKENGNKKKTKCNAMRKAGESENEKVSIASFEPQQNKLKKRQFSGRKLVHWYV